ncbi:gustatory and pheromone receptor 33a-like [Bradysia coprophila]|uniref:gustatory and pheromone receptor 33a-like n=1 Tax=Bradysia coprophila TaxID=38358 RepID=UPI00187D99C3|nr:gustatory and pheromone receptor 33a-like [Bradysia coprophila]
MLNWINVRHFYFGGKSPVGVVSNVFGLAPLIPGVMTPSIRVVNSLYPILWFILYLVCFYYYHITDIDPSANFPRICSIGLTIRYVLGICLGAVTYVLFIVKTATFNEFKTRFNNLDAKLYDISGFKTNFVVISNRFQVTLIICGLVLFVTTSVVDTLITVTLYHGVMIFAAAVVNIFPYLISGIIQAQFVSWIYLVNLRFLALNKALNHIATINESTSKAVKMYKAFDDEIENEDEKSETPLLFIIGDKLQGEEENALDDYNVKKPSAAWQDNKAKKRTKTPTNTNKVAPSSATAYQGLPKDMHKNMDSLFALHDSLLDISEDINDVYAIQIVTFITVSFVTILFGFFFETKVIFWLWGKNTQLILIASSYLIWSVMTALIIYTILTICTKAREAAYESALIVHKILQNKPVFMLNDEIYYNKMKSFTLQILHRKNTFNFNGLGLFQLDYTFIFSAVSAATSYLIVLLQFDLTADLN